MKKKKEGLKLTRRQFLKLSAMAGAGAVLPWKMAVREAYAQYGINSPNLTKFVDLMRGVGPGGIHVAAADLTPAPITGVTHYTINIGQFNDILHSDFATFGKPAYIPGFLGTKLWGFNPTKALGVGGTPPPIHLGGIIVAQRNVPVQITFNNNLPGPVANIIPNDDTIPLPAGTPRWDRVAVHLHGGFVPWISDGGPHDWWAPNGSSGLSFLNNTVLNPGAAANQGEYYYPNQQSARLMWYHDHAFGQTRTNAYAGIATGYVLVDPMAELAFDTANPGVPSALNLANLNNTFFYMVFQDKVFFGPNGPPANYPANAGPGDLFYADIYDPLLFGPAGIPSFGEPFLSPFPFPSVVPEFFGDTILVNGAAYPVLEVPAGAVRIRMLNACNSRFLNPRLVSTAGLTFPDNTEPKPNALGPGFIQIATEGGYLPAPAPVSGKGAPLLLLAPAERADLLVDFSGIANGTEFILYNDAPGPFPGGAAIFDYYPKNPKTPTSIPGFGPNTRTLLKIRVNTALPGTGTGLPAAITLGQAGLSEPSLVTQTPGVPTPIPASVTVGGVTYPVTVKTLTLNEGFDEYGRLAQFLGTDAAMAGVTPGFFGRKYMDLATETPNAGTVEVWQIANLTADTHPIHFHLVNVQILYRQAIKMKGFVGTFAINPNGQPIPPDLNELGYKETVRMNPGEVTTVIMKFDMPVVPFNVPPSTRDVGGNEYVWHCHILEHEEHDMMRPLFVQGTNPQLVATPATQPVSTSTGGTATYAVSGGAAPYTITSNPTDPNIAVPTTLAADGNLHVVVTAGAATGTYKITVTDSLGTPKTVDLVITV